MRYYKMENEKIAGIVEGSTEEILDFFDELEKRSVSKSTAKIIDIMFNEILRIFREVSENANNHF